jgi:hypothetical protein
MTNREVVANLFMIGLMLKSVSHSDQKHKKISQANRARSAR